MRLLKIVIGLVVLPTAVTPLAQANASQIFLGGDSRSTLNTNIPASRPDSTPQSDAARNDFLSRLSNPQTENFESFTPGNASGIQINFSGTTATFNGRGTIRNVPSGTSVGQYPTSGNQFLYTSNGNLEQTSRGLFITLNSFDFSVPVSSVGFYLTGITIPLGASTIIEVTKVNGTKEGVELPFGAHYNELYENSIVYFGAISDNPDDYISKINFNSRFSRRGVFAFDDLTIDAKPVPEPLTILGSLVAGVFGLIMRSKYKKTI